MQKPDLRVKLGSLTLQNPVMPASGTFGVETCKLCDIKKIGAILPKSVTLHPRQGNKPPRVAETTGGMLNAVGIQNKGLDYFIEEILPFYMPYAMPMIVSISAYSVDEFKRMVERLEGLDGIAAIELNISCPNLEAGGKAFGMNSGATYQIVKEVKALTGKVIIPKLTPNVEDITVIAKAAEEAGADAVALTNTFLGMAIDIKSKKPKLGNIIGGLSGPAIKPISLRMVWQTAQKIKIPVIGGGGIQNWEDAIEYLLAGASAIQVGTANFTNPNSMVEIVEGIEQYMLQHSIKSVEEIIGGLMIG
ncbi:dihydroorotate dehydrogenase [Geosporobacter ferrireducens]|uniref:Dihydroorotate dehydrogenase n=1 Tax=Geosporobacter ferrireducens TaxID=1424294 RepID=A0A1D8GG18_9FIRM|nr:dihydroorotate dehydrogenase [Geosporobacter ferrireducens]AOT69856.1 dihydroorotate dehydrogenase B catalytic subunit [Geosporobacter ferrireducens]MTI54449.1 dihydroorotate dehydrogenase [Geosporobacter ferrireducens]